MSVLLLSCGVCVSVSFHVSGSFVLRSWLELLTFIHFLLL